MFSFQGSRWLWLCIWCGRKRQWNTWESGPNSSKNHSSRSTEETTCLGKLRYGFSDRSLPSFHEGYVLSWKTLYYAECLFDSTAIIKYLRESVADEGRGWNDRTLRFRSLSSESHSVCVCGWEARGRSHQEPIRWRQIENSQFLD